MASVFSETLRILNAARFIDSVSDPTGSNIYLTFGKPTPWPDDNNPIQANTSVTSFNDVWKNMIGAKIISGNDVRHAIPRHNWVSGEVYDMYDHCTCSLILFDPNVRFYVVTSDWNVYKCLDNNNGKPSTVMPKQTITNSAIQEFDGYVWKYMYTVTHEERLRFTTTDYIPVRTLTVDNNSLQWKVQQAAINGGIEAIKVLNGGSGYSNSSPVNIIVNGDGSGAAGVGIVSANGTIDRVVITSPGSNYTYADVSISATTGANATFKAMISPTGGHGKDALEELGGSYVIMNPRLKNTENGKLSTDNEFRQISILYEPRERVSQALANNIVYSQVYKFIVSSGSANYLEDEVVYQGLSLTDAYFTGVVSSWDSTNNTIRLTNTQGIPQTDVLVGVTSAAGRFVESITNKDLLEYSGRLLYIDNISSIKRADDQTEDFKIVLKF